MPSRRVRSTLLLAFLCAAARSDAAAGEPIRLQLKWHHQFQFAGYYAAESQGYFAAEGLEVTLVEGNAAQPPIPEVLSGRAQFGIGDAGVAIERLRGEPLVACAAVFQHSPYVILSRRDRGIANPSDLVGTRIMLSEDQGAFQFRAMLQGEGIHSSRIEVVPHSWDLEDLVERRVDAVSAYSGVEPEQLRARGVEPSVLRTTDYGVDFYGDILFTSESEVQRDPERVAAFVRASLRGWEYAFAHPEELADRILELPGARERGLTRDLLLAEAREMHRLALPELVTLGHMNPGRWRHIAQLLAQQGLVPAEADLQGFLFDPDPPVSRKLLWWLAGLGAASLAGLALAALWNVQMRRRVAEKTLALRAEIAQRESAEAELRTSEERFRQIAENIHEVFWVISPDKPGMLYVSPAYEAIWGRTCQSLYENPGAWMESIHPEDRERIAHAATRQAVDGYDEVYRIVLPDGGERWIRDRAFPVLDGDGRVFRVVGTAEDVTEARRTEKQLLRAQRLESIGTLAGGIAHDLNNLLAPILMSVELVRKESNDVNVHSLADVVEASARRAAALVRQILAFARGVEGAKEVVQIAGLVEELRSMIDSTFPKDIRFESDVPGDVSSFLGDPTQVSQVLLNLALNSRDAMPKGGRLRLRVRDVRLDRASAASPWEPGPYLLLEWSDEGEGIPPEHRDQIFDPFFTTKEVGKGTGLGLAMVLAIVRGHGGHFDVESEMGRGTTFRIYLPALASSAGDAPAAPARRRLLEPAASSGELILVVDDEQTILRLTRRILEDAGYRVLTAEDGFKAAAAYAEHAEDIALVLTDLLMPKMDGLELITQLRRTAPGLPIIGTSGYFDESTVPQLQALGVERVLTKPFSRDALLDALQGAFGRDPSG